MKGKRILLGIMMVAALLILARPAISNADTYDGAWLPNSDDMFAINIDFDTAYSLNAFYMYDWGYENNDLEIVTDDGFDKATVFFTHSGNDNWYASLEKGGTELLLGDTLDFGFYFSDGTNNYDSYVLTPPSSGDSYTLSQVGMTVIVHDAAPVPIPETALLLTSGIFALVAIRRVRQ